MQFDSGFNVIVCSVFPYSAKHHVLLPAIWAIEVQESEMKDYDSLATQKTGEDPCKGRLPYPSQCIARGRDDEGINMQDTNGL